VEVEVLIPPRAPPPPAQVGLMMHAAGAPHRRPPCSSPLFACLGRTPGAPPPSPGPF